MQSSMLRTQAQSFSQTAGEVDFRQAFAAIPCSSSDSSTAPEPHSAVCDNAPIRQEPNIELVETVSHSVCCLAAANGCLYQAVQHTAAARGPTCGQAWQQHVADLCMWAPNTWRCYLRDKNLACAPPQRALPSALIAQLRFVLCPVSFFAAAAPSRRSTVAVRATYQEDRSSRGPRGRGRFSRRCE
jgi:hypothetical protein